MQLTVTPRAAAALERVLDSRDHEPEQVLRLISQGEQMHLSVDTANANDELVEHEGAVVMAIAPSVDDQLTGATLDAEEALGGPRLTLRRRRRGAPEA